jgi:hypothetical protein
MVLQARPDRAKEIEILVLRHQLVVLQRRTPALHGARHKAEHLSTR